MIGLFAVPLIVVLIVQGISTLPVVQEQEEEILQAYVTNCLQTGYYDEETCTYKARNSRLTPAHKGTTLVGDVNKGE